MGLSCVREGFHVNARLSATNKAQSGCCTGGRRACFVGEEGCTVRRREEKGWGQQEEEEGGGAPPTVVTLAAVSALLTGSRCCMCCRVTRSSTHARTQARYLPPVLHLPLTSGHNRPLIPNCGSSQMIGRFWKELEPPHPPQTSPSHVCVF